MAAPETTPPIFTRDWLIRLAATVTAVSVVAGGSIALVVGYVGDGLTRDARAELGVDAIERRQDALETSLGAALDRLTARLDTIDAHLVAVAGQAERALGADGILELLEGSAFIREPVYAQNDRVRISAEARRTPRGVDCTAQSRVGIFRDAEGNVAVGSYVGPLRQLGPEFDTYNFTFELPRELRPGRVSVAIETIYDCAGRTVRDVRQSLSFTLLGFERRGDAGPGAAQRLTATAAE